MYILSANDSLLNGLNAENTDPGLTANTPSNFYTTGGYYIIN